MIGSPAVADIDSLPTRPDGAVLTDTWVAVDVTRDGDTYTFHQAVTKIRAAEMHSGEFVLPNKPPLCQHQASVRRLLKLGVVGHDTYRGSLRMGLREQVHDGVLGVRVKVSGGFVGKDQGRLTDQCARHGSTLLLPTRQLCRIMLGSMPYADFLKE